MKQSVKTRLSKRGTFAGIIGKAVVSLLLIFVFCGTADAADSLRTVFQFGCRVLSNLNCSDTVHGNDLIDSATVQRYVRDAVIDVGQKISVAKAKTITTADGTFGYLVDGHLIRLDAALIKYNNTIKPLPVVPFEKFAEAYSMMASTYDTTFYSFAASHGDSVYIMPLPRNTRTIRVFYWSWGANVSVAADTVTLPQEMYGAVEYRATELAAAHYQNPVLMKIYGDLYLAEVAELRQLSGDRGKAE